MSNKKSFFKSVTAVLVVTFLFGSIAYTAIGATTDPVPDWIDTGDQSYNGVTYTRPTTPVTRTPTTDTTTDTTTRTPTTDNTTDTTTRTPTTDNTTDTTTRTPTTDTTTPTTRDTTSTDNTTTRNSFERATETVTRSVTDSVDQVSRNSVSESERSAIDTFQRTDTTQPPVAETPRTTAEGTTTTPLTTSSTTETAPNQESATRNAIMETIVSTETRGSQEAQGQTSGETPSVPAPETQTVYTSEVKDIVTAQVRDSLNTELKTATGNNVEVYLGDGKYAQISNDSDANKIAKITREYAGTTKLSTADLNNNGIDDVLEAGVSGTVSFDKSEKKKANDNVVYGVTENDAGKTVFVAAPDLTGKNTQQVVGDEPLFKAKVVLSKGEDATKNRDKKLKIKVVNEKYKVIDSQSVTTDESGVATYRPSGKLKDGTYFVTVSDDKGKVVDVRKVVVDAKKVPQAPKLELKEVGTTENKTSFLPYAEAAVIDSSKSPEGSFDLVQYLIENYIYRVFPYLDPKTKDVVAASGIPVVQGEVPRVIEGSAKPGAIVFVTWKSIIMSSVVIADAGQGKFKVEVPSDLPKGSHEVVAFVYDPSNNFVGNVTSLLFKK